MKPLDLDSLKQRWQDRDKDVSSALKLDSQALHTLLAGHTRSAFTRHARWLVATALFATLLLVGLLAFIVQVRHDLLYLLAAAPLLLLTATSWLQTVDEWRRWRRLDLSAPVTQVRAELALLRHRRLRLARWILLSSFLLWLPLLAVVVRGVLGGDLLRQLPASVVWANLALGAIVLLLGRWIAARVTHRYAASPLLQRLLDDSAGGSLSTVRERFEAQHSSVDPGASAQRAPALRRLQHGLFWRICVHAALMLVNGWYLLKHGGVASGLWPGIVLQLLLASLMVGAVVQRRLLVRILADGGSGEPVLLQEMLGMRTAMARAAGIAAPLAVAVLLQVLLHAAGWIAAPLAQPLGLVLLAVAALLMALLWRRRMTPLVLRLGDVLGLGALRGTRRVAEELSQGIP